MSKQRDEGIEPDGEAAFDLLGEPPSLNLPPRSIVGQSGRDYPEDAPTVMVRDLTELGIDPAGLAATPSPGFVGDHPRPQTPAFRVLPRPHNRRTPRQPRPRPASDPASVAVVSPVRVERPVEFKVPDVPMPDIRVSERPEVDETSWPQIVLLGVIAAVPVLVSLGIAIWMVWA